MCRFGSPLSPTFQQTNSFLDRIPGNVPVTSYSTLIAEYYTPYIQGTRDLATAAPDIQEIFKILNRSIYLNNTAFTGSSRNYDYTTRADDEYFAVRTCNAYWNPQVTISETNVDSFYLGMASQATEREDTIITPDLRGSVRRPFLHSEPLSLFLLFVLPLRCRNYYCVHCIGVWSTGVQSS